MKKQVAILGTRGIPAKHGGFETFAQRLALYLVDRGWEVTVYCQTEGGELETDTWQGVQRVLIPVSRSGASGTIEFDWKSVKHAARAKPRIALTLGYNTAVFCAALRLRGVTNIINMDGLEWRREKWKPHERAWLWANERLGCWLGNHLIADHPEIAAHLETRVTGKKITMIPYGADVVGDREVHALQQWGLEPDNYGIVVARPEPENSILEIVQAFDARPRTQKLMVLGKFDAEANAFHRRVLDNAGPGVIFPGGIYDPNVLTALRRHARFYVHGHRVGGTNPSLVEAMGAGNAILAHDNRFNRWVAGSAAEYFSDVDSADALMTSLFTDDARIADMRRVSVTRHDETFRWDDVLGQYETLLFRHMRGAEAEHVTAAGGVRDVSR